MAHTYSPPTLMAMKDPVGGVAPSTMFSWPQQAMVWSVRMAHKYFLPLLIAVKVSLESVGTASRRSVPQQAMAWAKRELRDHSPRRGLTPLTLIP